MHEQHLIRPSNKLQPFRTGYPHPTLPLTTHYADCFRLSTIGHSPPFYDYFRPSTTILGLFAAVHDHIYDCFRPSTTGCPRPLYDYFRPSTIILRLFSTVHDHSTTVLGRPTGCPRPLYDYFRPSTTILRLFSTVHDHSTTVFGRPTGCPRPLYDYFRPSTTILRLFAAVHDHSTTAFDRLQSDLYTTHYDHVRLSPTVHNLFSDHLRPFECMEPRLQIL